MNSAVALLSGPELLPEPRACMDQHACCYWNMAAERSGNANGPVTTRLNNLRVARVHEDRDSVPREFRRLGRQLSSGQPQMRRQREQQAAEGEGGLEHARLCLFLNKSGVQGHHGVGLDPPRAPGRPGPPRPALISSLARALAPSPARPSGPRRAGRVAAHFKTYMYCAWYCAYIHIRLSRKGLVACTCTIGILHRPVLAGAGTTVLLIVY